MAVRGNAHDRVGVKQILTRMTEYCACEPVEIRLIDSSSGGVIVIYNEINDQVLYSVSHYMVKGIKMLGYNQIALYIYKA